jgi:transcriptional regulator with XRE-family HTH domain
MNEEVRRAIGQRLRQTRRAAGLTQKYVADRLQLRSRQAVSAWERGESMPGTDEWYELAPLLGQSLDFLVYGIRTKPISRSGVMETIFQAPGIQPASPVYGASARA